MREVVVCLTSHFPGLLSRTLLSLEGMPQQPCAALPLGRKNRANRHELQWGPALLAYVTDYLVRSNMITPKSSYNSCVFGP